MKKWIISIIVIIVAFIFLFPTTLRYEDGGTVRYKAILYSVTNYHSMKDPDGFDTGIEIEIFGIPVYKNTTFEK